MSNQKTVLILHYQPIKPSIETVFLLGQSIEIRHVSCHGDLSMMAQEISRNEGTVDAIALQNVARNLRLRSERVEHDEAATLFGAAGQTPVVDGSGIRDVMDRWAVRLANDAQPGKPKFGYDLGLPPGVAYACLAETALLALEGRFEDYTLGRNIEMERVKEIYRLYKKHQLQLSGMRSHGHFLTEADLAEKRALSDELRRHPQKLAKLVNQSLPPAKNKSSSGYSESAMRRLLAASTLVGLLGLGVWLVSRRKR